MRPKLTPINNNSKLFPDIERILKNAGEQTAKAILVDYKVTHQTWKNDPGFSIRRPSPFVWEIGTSSDIYAYVNYGTRPHEIKPKTKPSLIFRAGFKAKTRPRWIVTGKQTVTAV